MVLYDSMTLPQNPPSKQLSHNFEIVMAKIEVKSATIAHCWKELTGGDIEPVIFEERMYKVVLPVVLLYDVSKEYIRMLSG